MADALDVMYRLRDMAGKAADILRAEIATAQITLDRLDQFGRDFEDSARLAAASDIFPNASALIPPISGLVHAAGAEEAMPVPPTAEAEENAQRDAALAQFESEGLTSRQALNAFHGFPLDWTPPTPEEADRG